MNERERKLAGFIMECYRWSEEQLRPYHRKFVKNYKQYRSVLDVSNWTWRSRIFIPKSMSLILNLLPRMIGDEPAIGVVGQGKAFQRSARMMEAKLKQDLRRMAYFLALYLQAQDSMVYGVGYRQNPWRYEEKPVRRRAGRREMDAAYMNDQPLPTVVTENKVVFDGPWTENLDVFDVYPDPSVTDLHRGDFVIVRKTVARWRLEEMAKYGDFKNIDKVLAKEPGGDEVVTEGEQSKALRDDASGKARRTGKQPTPLTPIKIYEFQGMVPAALSGQSRAQKMFILVADDVIIREKSFPYDHGHYNISYAEPLPMNGEMVGLSLLEPLSGLQTWENVLRNAMIDTMTMTQMPMWKRKRGAGIPSWQLRPRPAGIIDMEDPVSDLIPLDIKSHLPEMHGLLAANEQAWQEAGGVPMPVQGRDAPGMNKTARGVAMLIREATTRTKLMQNIFEKTVMMEDGFQFIEMNKQFFTSQEVLRIVGPDYAESATVFPWDIMDEFSLTPKIFPNEMFFRAMERENLAFVIQALKTSPNAQKYNFGPLDKRVMESYSMDDLVEQVMQENQQRGLPAASPRQIESGGPGGFSQMLKTASGAYQPVLEGTESSDRKPGGLRET